MQPAAHLRLCPAPAPAPAAGMDALVAGACAGDIAAWAELYARCYDGLLRQLRHLTGDLAIAEELAQETFAQAMTSRARYDRGRSFEAWLHGIALNMARKHWRSRKNTSAAHARLIAMHGASPSAPADPDRVHLQRERSRVLYDILAGLPDKLREAFLVRELQALPHDEAAALLEISPGNLAVRLTRARARIGEELRRLGWLPANPTQGAPR
ncbi:MAG: RNA polymerase sigma factor [Myxococcales bacterium]|nr:RNA polymerase sigma factor [Myxococcales bacterium]